MQAYLLPALHCLLAGGQADSKSSFLVLILVPTRELCEQVSMRAKVTSGIELGEGGRVGGSS